jgi:hypothetical protein
MKLAVVGRGTVGSLSVLHFLTHTDWHIDWYYDSSIPTTAVGEGTTLAVPLALHESIIGFTASDLYDMNGTPKLGIMKENWGSGDKFLHAFPAAYTAIHINAIEFQNKIFEELKNDPRITFIDYNVDDPENLPADFVMMCTGSPKKDPSAYSIKNSIIHNAAYVTQCYWDAPRFSHTLTLAREWGWVFGIPLQNRCSIGYIFNKEITDLDTIKESVKEVFQEYNLTPSNNINYLEFFNYSRKQNFTLKVAYNGNASYFLEPLEATSTAVATNINRWAFDLWTNQSTVDAAQFKYDSYLNEIENMIALHYIKNEVYDTEFWQAAKNKSVNHLTNSIRNDNKLKDYLLNSLFRDKRDIHNIHQNTNQLQDYGTWAASSFKQNIVGMNIQNEIINLLKETI